MKVQMKPFHLIGGGTAWLHVEDRSPRLLTQGDLVLFPQDQAHIIAHSEVVPEPEQVNKGIRLSLDGPMTHMVCGFFEFRNPASCSLLSVMSSVIHLDLGKCSALPRVKTYIDLMLSELRLKSPGYYEVVNQISFLLFVEILRQQIESGDVQEGILAALFDTKISKALEVIHNNAGENWSLEQLAARAGMSRSAFSQKFTRLVGSSPVQYLSTWRMQEATQKLQQSNLSIAQIGEECGYESEAAFRKAYKKITGNAPGQVRKTANGGSVRTE